MPWPRLTPLLHVLLAGGGTGGHVFPALAVAEELRARGWRVSFTGMAGGIEERLVGERGIPFHPCRRGRSSGAGLRAQARALTTLAGSASRRGRLVREIGADVVLGTGGYVSAPAVIGARLARRPVLLLEPNGKAGVANRWLSRCATAAAVGYRRRSRPQVPVPGHRRAGARRLLRGPGRAAAARAAAPPGARRQPGRAADQRGDAGGGGAARSPGFPRSASSTRPARGTWTRRGRPSPGGRRRPHVEVVPFLDDVAGAMAASHLLVSRAGAITLAEICAAGRASLLVPLAIAQGHQVDNARLIAEAGAAEMIRR